MRTLVILLSALLLTACEEPKPTESLEEVMDDTPQEHAEKHLDTKYVCPMHPEIVSDKPGSCSICGMFLVKKEVESEESKTTSEPAEKSSDTNK